MGFLRHLTGRHVCSSEWALWTLDSILHFYAGHMMKLVNVLFCQDFLFYNNAAKPGSEQVVFQKTDYVV